MSSMSSLQRFSAASEISVCSPAHVCAAISAACVASSAIFSASLAASESGSRTALTRSAHASAVCAATRARSRACSACAMSRRAFVEMTPSSGKPFAAAVACSERRVASTAASYAVDARRMSSSA